MTTGIASALLAFQKDAPALQKNAINPHFKSKFISLDSLMEQVLPVLNKHDLVLTQFPAYVLGAGDAIQPALRTRLMHAGTGEWIEDTMPLLLAKNDPQGQGSAITYGRRYSLMAVLGLVADTDDDANAASTSPARATRPNEARPSAPASDDPPPF